MSQVSTDGVWTTVKVGMPTEEFQRILEALPRFYDARDLAKWLREAIHEKLERSAVLR